MTQIANKIESDSTFETIFKEAKKCKLSMAYHVDIERQNRIKEFEVKVYKGEIELPNRYFDRVKYFKNMYRENISSALEKFREIGVEPPICILRTPYSVS